MFSAQASAQNQSEKESSRSRLKYLVRLALMMSIIVVMSFTPLGYLKVTGLSITFLMIPVAVGGMILGPGAGALLGLTFGITSAVNAFTSPFGTTLIAISLPAMMFTSIVPRILEGWLAALVFKALRAKMRNIAYFASAFSCALLNTVLFMSCIVVFFYSSDYIQGVVTKLGAPNPLAFVVGFVGIQGLIEAIVCTLVAAAVAKGVSAALKQ